MTMAGGPGGGSVEVGAVSFRIGVDLSQFQQDLARAEELARQRAQSIQQHFNSLSMQASGTPQAMAGSGAAARPRPRASEQARAGQQQLPGMDRFQQRLGQTQAAAAADSQAAQGAQPLPTPEPPPPATPAPVERVRRVRTRDYHTTETGAPEPVSPPTPVSQQRQIETRDVRSSIAPQPTPEPPPPAKKIQVEVPPQIVAIPGPPPSATLPYTQVPTSSGQPMFVPSRASGPQQTQRTVPPTVSGIPAPQRPTVHIPPTAAPPPPPPVGTRHGIELSGREVGQPAHPPAVTTTVAAAIPTPAPAASAAPVAAAVQKQVSEVETAVAATIDGVTQALKGQIVQWTGAAGARMQGRVVSEKPGGKLRVNVGGAYASTQRENVTLPYGYEQAGGAAPPPAAPTQTPAPEPVAPTPAPAAPPPPRAPRTPRAPRPPPVYGPYGAAAPRAEPTVSPAPPALPRSGEPPRVHFEPAEEGAFFKPAYVLSTSGIYKAEVPAVRGVSRSQNTQTALSQYFSGAAPKVKPSEFPPYARHLALERQAEAIEARERAERVAAAEVAGPKPAGPTVRPGEVQQLPDVGPALGPEELLPPVAPLEIKPLEGEASVIQSSAAPRVPPSRRYEYQRSKSIAEELTTGAQPAIEAYREGEAPVRTLLSRSEAAQRLLEQRRRGAGSGAATPPIRALEHGGHAEPGKVHLIGERGPELFIPREAGYVLSNEQTRELGGLVAARATGGSVRPEDSVEYKVQQFVRQHKGKGFSGEQLTAHFQSLGLEVPGGKFGGAAMPGSKDFDALLKAVPTARYWYEQIGSGLEQRLGAPVFNEAAFLTAITSPRTAVDDNVAAALSGMGWIRELEAAGHPVGQRVTQADIDAAKAEHAKKLADFAELQQRRTDAVPVFEAARRANDAAAASRLLRGPAGAPSLVSGRLKAARDWTPEIWEDLHDKLQKSLTAKKPVLQTLKIGDIRASDELQKLWQETPGTLRVNVSKATLNNLADAYLNGFATAGGFKTPSYYSNIGAGRARMPDPYTTIDTWMAGVFGYGMSKGQAEVAAADPQLFRAMHAAVTELGAQHGLHGYQMQAALWVPFKTLVEAARAKGAEREQVAARQMLAGEISPAEAVKIAHETGLFGKATGSWADVEHTDQVQAALQRLEKHGLGGAGLQPAGGKLAGAQLVFKGTKDQGAGQPHRGVSRTQQQAFAAAGGQDPIRFAITSTPLLTKELEKAGIGAKAAGGPTATFAISETMARLEKAGLVPASEVGQRLLGGPRDLPAYMAPVSEFMGEQSARIARGALSQEEVATAYLTTLSSIRGQEISVAAAEAKAGGLDLSGALSTVKGKAKVRPEDAFAEWIKTAGGQKALQDIHDGRIEQVQHAIHAARVAQMGGFGFPSFYGKKKSPEPAPVFRTPKPGRYNLHNIQQATDAFNEAGASGKLGAVEQVASQFEGIGAGKTGFLASWLGSARLPTLDVNALKTWLGDEGGALAVKAMGSARGMRTVGPELQQAVIGRHREMQSLGYLRGVPEDQLPGVMHWTLFDAAKLAETTHSPIFEAMRASRRAAGGPVRAEMVQSPARGQSFQQFQQLLQVGQQQLAGMPAGSDPKSNWLRNIMSSAAYTQRRMGEARPGAVERLDAMRAAKGLGPYGVSQLNRPIFHYESQAPVNYFGEIFEPHLAARQAGGRVRSMAAAAWQRVKPNNPMDPSSIWHGHMDIPFTPFSAGMSMGAALGSQIIDPSDPMQGLKLAGLMAAGALATKPFYGQWMKHVQPDYLHQVPGNIGKLLTRRAEGGPIRGAAGAFYNQQRLAEIQAQSLHSELLRSQIEDTFGISTEYGTKPDLLQHLEAARGFLEAPKEVLHNLIRQAPPVQISPESHFIRGESPGTIGVYYPPGGGVGIAGLSHDVAGTATHEAAHVLDFRKQRDARLGARMPLQASMGAFAERWSAAAQQMASPRSYSIVPEYLPSEYATTAPEEGFAEIVRAASAELRNQGFREELEGARVKPFRTIRDTLATHTVASYGPLRQASGILQRYATEHKLTPSGGQELKARLIEQAGLGDVFRPEYQRAIGRYAAGGYVTPRAEGGPVEPEGTPTREQFMQALLKQGGVRPVPFEEFAQERTELEHFFLQPNGEILGSRRYHSDVTEAAFDSLGVHPKQYSWEPVNAALRLGNLIRIYRMSGKWNPDLILGQSRSGPTTPTAAQMATLRKADEQMVGLPISYELQGGATGAGFESFKRSLAATQRKYADQPPESIFRSGPPTAESLRAEAHQAEHAFDRAIAGLQQTQRTHARPSDRDAVEEWLASVGGAQRLDAEPRSRLEQLQQLGSKFQPSFRKPIPRAEGGDVEPIPEWLRRSRESIAPLRRIAPEQLAAAEKPARAPRAPRTTSRRRAGQAAPVESYFRDIRALTPAEVAELTAGTEFEGKLEPGAVAAAPVADDEELAAQDESQWGHAPAGEMPDWMRRTVSARTGVGPQIAPVLRPSAATAAGFRNIGKAMAAYRAAQAAPVAEPAPRTRRTRAAPPPTAPVVEPVESADERFAEFAARARAEYPTKLAAAAAPSFAVGDRLHWTTETGAEREGTIELITEEGEGPGKRGATERRYKFKDVTGLPGVSVVLGATARPFERVASEPETPATEPEATSIDTTPPGTRPLADAEKELRNLNIRLGKRGAQIQGGKAGVEVEDPAKRTKLRERQSADRKRRQEVQAEVDALKSGAITPPGVSPIAEAAKVAGAPLSTPPPPPVAPAATYQMSAEGIPQMPAAGFKNFDEREKWERAVQAAYKARSAARLAENLAAEAAAPPSAAPTSAPAAVRKLKVTLPPASLTPAAQQLVDYLDADIAAGHDATLTSHLSIVRHALQSGIKPEDIEQYLLSLGLKPKQAEGLVAMLGEAQIAAQAQPAAAGTTEFDATLAKVMARPLPASTTGVGGARVGAAARPAQPQVAAGRSPEERAAIQQETQAVTERLQRAGLALGRNESVLRAVLLGGTNIEDAAKIMATLGVQAPAAEQVVAHARQQAAPQQARPRGTGMLQRLAGFVGKVTHREAGGPAGEQQGVYLVGERGPEIFVPHAPGYVLAHDQAKRAVSEGRVGRIGQRQFGGPVTETHALNYLQGLATPSATEQFMTLFLRGGNPLNMLEQALGPSGHGLTPRDARSAFQSLELAAHPLAPQRQAVEAQAGVVAGGLAAGPAAGQSQKQYNAELQNQFRLLQQLTAEYLKLGGVREQDARATAQQAASANILNQRQQQLAQQYRAAGVSNADATRLSRERAQAELQATGLTEQAERRNSGLRIFGQTPSQIVRAGAALVGLNLGFNVLVGMARIFHQTIADTVDETIRLGTTATQVNIAFGQLSRGPGPSGGAAAIGAGFQRFQAAPLVAQTQASYQQTAASLAPLADQYELTANEVQQLSTSSAQLAEIWGGSQAQAAQALQGVLRGNSQAAEQYNIDLVDQYGRIRALGLTYQELASAIGPAAAAQQMLALEQQAVSVQVDSYNRGATEQQRQVNELGREWSQFQTALAGIAASPITGFLTELNALLRDTGNLLGAVHIGAPQQSPATTTRAAGGPAGVPGSYLVGEKGPELFVPNSSGYVYSNQQTRGILGSRQDGGPVDQLSEAAKRFLVATGATLATPAAPAAPLVGLSAALGPPVMQAEMEHPALRVATGAAIAGTLAAAAIPTGGVSLAGIPITAQLLGGAAAAGGVGGLVGPDIAGSVAGALGQAALPVTQPVGQAIGGAAGAVSDKLNGLSTNITQFDQNVRQVANTLPEPLKTLGNAAADAGGSIAGLAKAAADQANEVANNPPGQPTPPTVFPGGNIPMPDDRADRQRAQQADRDRDQRARSDAISAAQLQQSQAQNRVNEANTRLQQFQAESQLRLYDVGRSNVILDGQRVSAAQAIDQFTMRRLQLEGQLVPLQLQQEQIQNRIRIITQPNLQTRAASLQAQADVLPLQVQQARYQTTQSVAAMNIQLGFFQRLRGQQPDEGTGFAENAAKILDVATDPDRIRNQRDLALAQQQATETGAAAQADTLSKAIAATPLEEQAQVNERAILMYQEQINAAQASTDAINRMLQMADLIADPARIQAQKDLNQATLDVANAAQKIAQNAVAAAGQGAPPVQQNTGTLPQQAVPTAQVSTRQGVPPTVQPPAGPPGALSTPGTPIPGQGQAAPPQAAPTNVTPTPTGPVTYVTPTGNVTVPAGTAAPTARNATAAAEADAAGQRVQAAGGSAEDAQAAAAEAYQRAMASGPGGTPAVGRGPRQAGGEVAAGGQYLVGEAGPEMFAPAQWGGGQDTLGVSNMLRATQLGDALSGGGGGIADIAGMMRGAGMSPTPGNVHVALNMGNVAINNGMDLDNFQQATIDAATRGALQALRYGGMVTPHRVPLSVAGGKAF